MKIFPKSQLEF